ncbi:hypothetical protein ALP63_101391 [Pseudomonas syringae pv. aceris]|nr:hypothetical protein ALP63_101391 [Pseudomonas syringae pv. aceris]RMS64733.1 hypothetical protein ALP62_101335 [Pseudomonas syringae pv. aceris]
MVKETGGYGHRTHPFEIHGDRGSCRFSNLHEQKPGQSAVRIVALCQNFRNTYSLPGIHGCVCGAAQICDSERHARHSHAGA